MVNRRSRAVLVHPASRNAFAWGTMSGPPAAKKASTMGAPPPKAAMSGTPPAGGRPVACPAKISGMLNLLKYHSCRGKDAQKRSDAAEALRQYRLLENSQDTLQS